MRAALVLKRQASAFRGHRAGAAVPWIIMMLPVLALAMALAVEIASNSHRQLQMQNMAEAVSLASANALAPTKIRVDDSIVSDILLTNRVDRQDDVVDEARAAANRYATLNPFPGGETPLDLNPTNALEGELLLGTLDNTNDAPVWHTPPYPGPNLYAPHLNVARVQMERQGIRVSATAYVDRDVVGFKVQGSSGVVTGTPAIPVVPLAVLTDWTAPVSTKSWDHNIIARQGTDFSRLGAADAPLGDIGTQLPDSIPEITVRISADPADNGQVVAIPSGGDFDDAMAQIGLGITRPQLVAFSPGNPQLGFSGSTNEFTLSRFTPTGAELNQLATELTAIRGQRRVWLLHDSATMTDLHVVGFVAARVMVVKTEVMGGATTAVEVTLQPTMLLTSTAVTDRGRRMLGPREVQGVGSIFNPYIARVRLLK